ncbi:hypothetical protein EVAR_90726_1 [Eumeta japonica]|uniref:Uncharacterized protein n=1 Tax=Eumeta variegata TaxID=151549 RepID=A0A4C2A4W4_EUMVA|nr:hypothetical protein EVAR_90726_1 [Eumeta japonica]
MCDGTRTTEVRLVTNWGGAADFNLRQIIRETCGGSSINEFRGGKPLSDELTVNQAEVNIRKGYGEGSKKALYALFVSRMPARTGQKLMSAVMIYFEE